MSDAAERCDIKSLTREQIGEMLGSMGQAPWRTGQMVRWLYQRGACSFAEMTDLPASLREALSDRCDLPVPDILERQVASDGTRKYLLGLRGGAAVESVGIPADGRLTVCFSTQAGCAMGCSFCATGRSGLVRNLGPGEMVDQITAVARDFGERVSNAVAMGQGEPFANYDSVLAALRFANSKDGPGIGARHITVSTCGIIPGIRRFASEPEQFTLAVSLHSAVQATRDHLMPGVRSYPLGSLRDALHNYEGTTGRRPTLEYALIDGVNDTDEQLTALVRWCRGLACHVNLIPLNPVDETGMKRAGTGVARHFRDVLMKAGIEASVRTERGSEIDAACGQLRQRQQQSPAVG